MAREIAARREKAAQALIKRHDDLLAAINELTGVNANQLKYRTPDPHPGVTVDPNLTSSALLTNHLQFQATLRDVNIEQFKASTDRGKVGNTDPLKLQDVGGSVSALGLARDLLAVPRGLDPKGPWTPQGFKDIGMRLADDAILSDTILPNWSEISQGV
jgi:hypothetical protein